MAVKKQKDEHLKKQIEKALKNFPKVVKDERKRHQKEAELGGVITMMRDAGLPMDFIMGAFSRSHNDKIHKLMKKWIDETDSPKRNGIVSNLQKILSK